MVLEEFWKHSLGIFVHAYSHAVSHSFFKTFHSASSEGCTGHQSQIWKWVVCGYMGMHIIKAMLRQPASFGWWSVGLMCHKKTFPGLLHQRHRCALVTQGRKDVWIYDVPDSGHTICLSQAGFCKPCSVYPILAIQIWWSCVNCSLSFLFSAGTKLLCLGLGKELGRAADNTTDNRFILATACLLLIFS